jgi:carboxypeptidase family protein
MEDRMRKWVFPLTFLIQLSVCPLKSAAQAVRPADALRPATIKGHVLTVDLIQAGLSVTLYDDKNVLRQTTQTNMDGFYQFEDVPPGNYQLAFSGRGVPATRGEPFTASQDSVSDLDYPIRPSTAALLSAARASARWSPQEFANSVREYPQWYVGQNEVNPCADRLAAQLIQQALTMPSPQQNLQTATRIATRSGVPPELASQVAGRLSQNLADIVITAQDFSDLSVAIRGLINGDSSPYVGTQLYRSVATDAPYRDFFIAALEQMNPQQFSGYGQLLRVVTESIVFEFTFPVASAVCGSAG